MNKSKKSEFFGGRSVKAALSNLGLRVGSQTHARSRSRERANDSPNSRPVDDLDVSLDVSIAGFKTLKEAAEVIPVAGGPLKATCGIMILILQLIKRCKENREGWEKLADLMREKNESIVVLLELYSKAPTEYPSAEKQAKEYQRVLNSIAVDIKHETQKTSEVSQGLGMYWSRMQSTGREAILANVNAEKITNYQEQLRRVTFDVVEKTVIHQALVMNDMRTDLKAVLTDKSSLKAPTAILKPRPRRVRNFVGRGDILDAISKTHFGDEASTSNDDGPTVTVLTGMGGSGKTQIAVGFASLFEERYPNVPVFFLDASSETSLNADLVTLVRSQTDKYDDALTWLANGTTNWLLIMDNADEPSLKFSKFLPRTRHGHVIITTRNATHKLLAPQSTHVVDALPMEDSISLLLTSSQCEDNEVNRSLAGEIAEELGRLPLALAHAAAYILINGCLDTFLTTYGESRDQFLKSTPDLPHGYPHSVERTIEMSFQCLSPRVQEMMGLFAHMDARSIPRCVIERAAERSFLHIPQQAGFAPHPDTIAQANTLQSIFCPSGGWKAFEFDGMIGECLKYSLLQFSTADGEKFYSMHPLVQRYLQSVSSSVRDCPAGGLIVRLLASATTVDGWYDFIGFDRLLGPHVRLAQLEEVTEAGDHYGFGRILAELGNDLSIAHMEQCVERWRSSGGQGDKAVLVAITGLATSYRLVGRDREALPLQEEVLKQRKRLLGLDHLDTLTAMANLAGSYWSLGREQEALLLEEEVLKQRTRLLGLDHLDTLRAMANLASSYWSLGREQEALPLDEEVLKQQKRLLGLDHLDTLRAMANLASSYWSLGREQEALPLDEEVLKQRKRLLGPDHLDTLTAMANLASSYRSLGREQEALPLQEEVLKQRKRLLGLDHLDTLTAMANLAGSYWSLGREQEALLLEEEVLKQRTRLLGLDHLDTLRAMANLASSYRSLGREQEALPLEEEIFKNRKRLLGPNHLDTLVAMGNLAATYQSLGREKEALLLEEEALGKLTRLLGSAHRDTLQVMRSLLVTLKALGMKADLKTLGEAALPLHETVYGVDHRHTVRVRNLLIWPAEQ